MARQLIPALPTLGRFAALQAVPLSCSNRPSGPAVCGGGGASLPMKTRFAPAASARPVPVGWQLFAECFFTVSIMSADALLLVLAVAESAPSFRRRVRPLSILCRFS